MMNFVMYNNAVVWIKRRINEKAQSQNLLGSVWCARKKFDEKKKRNVKEKKKRKRKKIVVVMIIETKI